MTASRLWIGVVACALLALPLTGLAKPPDKEGKDNGRHVGQVDNRGKQGVGKTGKDRGRHIGQIDNRGKHLGRLKNKKKPVVLYRHMKDDWAEIARGAGCSDVLGKIRGDRTLVFTGQSGAPYSVERYQVDLKSKNKVEKLRATYFGRTYFYREGKRYERVKVQIKEKTYYKFVRK